MGEDCILTVGKELLKGDREATKCSSIGRIKHRLILALLNLNKSKPKASKCK